MSVNMLLSWLHALADYFLWLWRFWDILNENYSTKYCIRTPIQPSYTANQRRIFKYVYFPIDLWVLNVAVSCVTCSSTTLNLRLVNCRDKTLYKQALRKTENEEIIFINHSYHKYDLSYSNRNTPDKTFLSSGSRHPQYSAYVPTFPRYILHPS